MSNSYRFPTQYNGKEDYYDTAELFYEEYRRLVDFGGITLSNHSQMIAAAQILDELHRGTKSRSYEEALLELQPRSLKDLISKIHLQDEVAVPSITERRALVALVKSGLVRQIGITYGVKYLPGPFRFADGENNGE